MRVSRARLTAFATLLACLVGLFGLTSEVLASSMQLSPTHGVVSATFKATGNDGDFRTCPNFTFTFHWDKSNANVPRDADLGGLMHRDRDHETAQGHAARNLLRVDAGM